MTVPSTSVHHTPLLCGSLCVMCPWKDLRMIDRLKLVPSMRAASPLPPEMHSAEPCARTGCKYRVSFGRRSDNKAMRDRDRHAEDDGKNDDVRTGVSVPL